MPPVVSVVIPSYNSRTYLKRALTSLEAQRCKELDLEIIVVDDGSDDGTQDYLKKSFPQVQCLRQANAGASRARNRGMDAATGDYLVFLDADDILCRGCLHSGVESLRRHSADISVCLCLNHVEGASGGHFWPLRRGQYPLHLWHSNISPVHTFMLRRSSVGERRFSPLPACEDWLFWCQCAHAGLRFVSNTDGMAVYVHRPQSLSRTVDGQHIRMHVLKTIGENLNNNANLPEEGLFAAALAHLAGVLACTTEQRHYSANNIPTLLRQAKQSLLHALRAEKNAAPPGLAERSHALQACALACALPAEAQDLTAGIRALGRRICPEIQNFSEGASIHAAWRAALAQIAVPLQVMERTFYKNFDPQSLNL